MLNRQLIGQMNIVLISKSYYPIQSARSLRTTELAQQFARMGHNVTVYAVSGLSDYTEYSKRTGVKVKLIPTRIIPSNVKRSKVYSLIIKVLSVLLGRLIEFPSIELRYQVPKLLKKENNVDLLITIALPYTIHWGAAFAKRKSKLSFPQTWVSDCGDPYMGNDVYTPFFYFKYYEKFWGDMTDYVTIPIKEAASAYFDNVQDKIRVIPQGFDFAPIQIDQTFKGNNIPHFAYTGTLFPGYRDLTSFLEFLCSVNQDFRFYVYTKTPETVEPFRDRLKERLIISDYIPRLELVYKLSQMDFLINLTNKSVVQSPSKLIDYGLAKRPILDVSTPFVEKDCFEAFMLRNYSKRHPEFDIQQYNIENVAKQFLALTKEK